VKSCFEKIEPYGGSASAATRRATLANATGERVIGRGVSMTVHRTTSAWSMKDFNGALGPLNNQGATVRDD
jgi:hypothetical protein